MEGGEERNKVLFVFIDHKVGREGGGRGLMYTDVVSAGSFPLDKRRRVQRPKKWVRGVSGGEGRGSGRPEMGLRLFTGL